VWLLAAATQPLSLLLTGRVWPFLVAGLVAPGLARVGLYVGVHRVGASRASALASCTPLFAVTMAVLGLGEQPAWGLLAGAVAIVAGGVFLSYRGRDDRAWRRRDLVFPLLGAVGFAFRDNVSRWGFAGFPYPLLAAVAATAASVTVMWAVVLAVRGTGLVGVTRRGFQLLALSGLAEGLAYLAMWRALMLAPVSVVSPLVNSHSIFTVVLAWLFLRDLERVTWRMAVATALLVAGVGLVVGYGTS
jgi:transporter family protein